MYYSSNRSIVIAAIVIFVVTVLCFVGVLGNDFVNWDDQVYVLENPHIKEISPSNALWILTHSYFRSYTPLSLLSHALDYHWWGLDPRGHHATSLVLHAANGVLLFLLILAVLNRIVGSAGTLIPSVFGSLLFALHPLRVESVAWIADRKDLLCAFFLLPAYLSYLRYASLRGPGRALRWYVASVLLFLLALLSKPSALTAPIVLLLLDVFLLYPTTWRAELRRIIVEKLPFLGLSMAAGLVAVILIPDVNTAAHLTTTEKYLLPFYSLVMTMRKLFWPTDLSPVYDNGSVIAMFTSMLIVMLVSAACIILLRLKRPWWLATWLYFLIVSVPTTTFHSAGIQAIADRYTYFSTLGFSVLAVGVLRGSALAISENARRVLFSGITIIVSALGFLSRDQVTFWRTSESLWRRAIAISPSLAIPYSNLGNVLVKEERFEEAATLYQVARRIDPDTPDAETNLGVAYVGLGRLHEADELFLRAIRRWPGKPNAFVNRGELKIREESFAEAEAMFARVLALDPQSAQANTQMGFLLYREGYPDSALVFLSRATKLQEDLGRAHYYLGLVRLQRGEINSARESLSTAARLGYAGADAALREHNLPGEPPVRVGE